MSIKINFKNNDLNKSSANTVLFVDENFNISSLKKYLSNLEFSYVSDLLKNSDLKKNLLFFISFFKCNFNSLGYSSC